MKRFLFHYWNDSHVTKWYTKTKTKAEAVEKFRKLKGDKFIVAIEEVKEETP